LFRTGHASTIFKAVELITNRWPDLSNHIVVYDADCGPCRRFKHFVNFLDIYNQIDFISLTQADELGLLKIIPQYLRYKSFHLISHTGDIQSGAEALPGLISLFPLGHHISKLIILAPGGKRMMTYVYLIFSRFHDGSSCNLHSEKAN
jgi:predicted DCC family thiol-disulfide oxidoreductase YuxK